MAVEGMLQIRDSHPVSADLSAHQYKIVVLDASAELALAATGGTGGFVLLDTPASGNGTILLAGKGKVIAGAAVSAGEFLSNEVTTGHAIPATTGDYIVGVALEDGVDGQVIKFLATPGAPAGTIA
jgi:hypothetical protein